MATKLRLQRHGRTKQAYYYIVAADSRAPRDGRFIERVGDYNPNTNPATINLDLKKAVKWLDNGAQPTDTVRAILSYKGAMMLHHLHGGVNKGALTTEQADAKFEAWMNEKATKVTNKKETLASKKAQTAAEKFKAETAVKEAKAAAIVAKNTVVEPVEETVEVVETAETVVATDAVETVVEATENVVETVEATEPIAETTETVVEVTETVVEETPSAETPAAEEETPTA